MNDELLKENKRLKDQIEKLLNERKFGLVWENTIEDNETADYTVTLEKELSINLTADTAEHLLFEGDNLLSLRELQKTHKEKIDVIYIDPPYNTGNKFVYSDKLKSGRDVYSHSAWLSFMEKRLSLAKNLLSNDGVIFVSIDDNEHAQLKLLMDKVFEERNFISNLIWRKGGGKSDSKYLANRKEYILIYKKNKLTRFKHKLSNSKNYKEKDARGYYQLRGFGMQGLNYASSLDYPIKAPDGSMIYAGGSKEKHLERKKGYYKQKDWCWTLSKKEFYRRSKNKEIVFKKVRGNWKVYYKSYLEGKESPYEDIYSDVTNATGSREIKNIFNGENVFQYTKPTKLIKFLLNLYSKDTALVLDFFAGSGTTGHAVMELNKEDGGDRKFILCTNNEVSEEKEREYLATNGYIEKPHKRLYNNFKKEQPEQYEAFLNSKDYQALGIARSVTHERLKRVIEGYTTPKGEVVKGLVNNKVKHYIIERT